MVHHLHMALVISTFIHQDKVLQLRIITAKALHQAWCLLLSRAPMDILHPPQPLHPTCTTAEIYINQVIIAFLMLIQSVALGI